MDWGGREWSGAGEGVCLEEKREGFRLWRLLKGGKGREAKASETR